MEQILYSFADNKGLAAIIGFLLSAIESFIPVLPLVAMILANAIILGMWLGFFVSWMGSSIASIILYICSNKFFKLTFFNKYRDLIERKNIPQYLEEKGFSIIFISYLCPFISDFLITIACGLTGVDIKTFISAMMCGKFVMFLFVSYVGNDINSFFASPFKISLFSLFIIFSWIIGRNINKNIHK